MNHLRTLLGDFSRRYRDVISGAGTARVLLVLLDTGGNVRRELHDFVQTPRSVVDRVVVGLQPDDLTAFIHALELPVEELALIQTAPEILIGAAVDQRRGAEQTVMLALELGEVVTHARKKILVGGKNVAVEIELDHRHRPINRLQLGVGLVLLLHLGGDIHGVLDHFDHPSRRILDRVITGLEPDRLAFAVDPFKSAGLELAILQARPQLGVLDTATEFRRAEMPVRLADRLGSRVTHGLEEIVIGT